MNNRELIIIGAGGHGKVCADIALEMGCWDHIAFLGDRAGAECLQGIQTIGLERDFIHYIDECEIFVAIGDNELRADMSRTLESYGASIPILVHPKAILGRNLSIGAGTVVMAGSIVNPCTRIGKSCIVNTGSTIDHDCVINDYVHISPGVHIAGSVSVGAFAWLGIGSIVRNNINITSRCTVGAGAVVVTDIMQQGTYVGVPARLVKN